MLRGGLQQKHFITNADIHDAIKSSACLNWIDNEIFLVNDDIRAVMRVFQYISD